MAEFIFEEGPTDSPFVATIWRTHSERAGSFISRAVSHWEMVVTRQQGKTTLTVRGPERKVIVSEFVSVDGVMEDPGGAEQLEHGGWTRAYWHDDIAQFKFDELFASDALLLGRVTYQGFAAAWPSMSDDVGCADRMNSLPKYVVSTTLDKAEWTNSHLIKENVAEEVTRLTPQPGQDILVAGSGTLVRTLMQHDLVDNYHLLLYPVVLGSGKRLFTDGGTTTLRLVDTKTFSSGVVLLVYQTAPRE